MFDTLSLPPNYAKTPTARPDIFSLYGKYLIDRNAKDLKTDTVAIDPRAPVRLPIYSAAATNDTTAENVRPVVGILGAGPGGLYAAMILTTLDIPFEIIEAQDRTGGRLYTHHFDGNDPKYKDYMTGHDYYVSYISKICAL